jgi:hypothetical protein
MAQFETHLHNLRMAYVSTARATGALSSTDSHELLRKNLKQCGAFLANS